MDRKFIWTSNYDATAGDAVLAIANTASERVLSVTNIFLGSLANNRFHIFRVSGIPTGTEIFGQNRSGLASNTTPGTDGRSYGNAAVSGLTQTTILAPTVRVPANRSKELPFVPFDLVLASGQGMAVYAQVSGEMEVTVMAEYG